MIELNEWLLSFVVGQMDDWPPTLMESESRIKEEEEGEGEERIEMAEQTKR